MISDLQWIYTSTKQNLYWLIGLHLFKYRPVVAKCIWYDYLVAVTLWKVGSLVAIVSFGPEKVTHWTHYDVKSVAICSAFITDRALIVRVWAVLWHSIYPSSFDGLEFEGHGADEVDVGLPRGHDEIGVRAGEKLFKLNSERSLIDDCCKVGATKWPTVEAMNLHDSFLGHLLHSILTLRGSIAGHLTSCFTCLDSVALCIR